MAYKWNQGKKPSSRVVAPSGPRCYHFEVRLTYMLPNFPSCILHLQLIAISGFDMKGLSMEASIEEELDASVAYVASLLAEEPPYIKLVIGGFSMGAATSLYCAICFAHGRFGENVKLDAVVACSGWFPITKLLDSEIKGIEASLPICLFHVKEEGESER